MSIVVKPKFLVLAIAGIAIATSSFIIGGGGSGAGFMLGTLMYCVGGVLALCH